MGLLCADCPGYPSKHAWLAFGTMLLHYCSSTLVDKVAVDKLVKFTFVMGRFGLGCAST